MIPSDAVDLESPLFYIPLLHIAYCTDKHS